MKISEMIKALENVKATHGDLEVTVFDMDAYSNQGYLTPTTAYLAVSEGDAESLTLCDRETYDAFMDELEVVQ